MNARRLNATALAASIMMMQMPYIASAQNPPAPGTDEKTTTTTLDSIQVTAQFRAQNMQDTPLAISALNTEMMDARSQRSVLDIAGAVPNVNIKPIGGYYGNGAAVSIRGVGQYDTSFALEPGVGIYIDDVYHPTLIGSAFDLLDLERVEILRGPQGTLAGKNSIGGAIRLYSRVPDEVEEGSIEASIGSLGRIDLRGSANMVLRHEQLFLRMAAVSKRRDGYLTRYHYGCRNRESGVSPRSARGDCILGMEGGEQYQGVRAALRWLPAGALEINLIADASDVDNEPVPGILLAGPGELGGNLFLDAGRYANYSTYEGNGWNAAPINTVQSRGISGKLDWRLGERYHLTSITSYREHEGEFSVDLDHGFIPFFTQQWRFWNHTFSQELRLNGAAFSDRLEYTLGAYYFDATSTLEGIADIEFFFAYHDDPVVSRNKSAFGHLMYKLSERWDISAGVRFTDEFKSYTFTRLDPLTRIPLNTVHGQTGYYAGSRWDYRLATSWRVNDEMMMYGSWSTGFKGGGINPRPFTPGQVAPFRPEVLKAWELGMKADLFDRRVRLNTSLFWNDYSDILMTITNGYADFPASAIPLNVGQADVRGAEVELTAYPLEGLMLDASWSYLDFEYQYLSDDALDSQIGYGMIGPYTSRHKASFGIQYAIRLLSGAARGTLTPRLDASYYSDFFTISNNTALSRVDGATVANARLGWRPDNADWEAVLGVTNLFDRYYYHNKLDVFAASRIANANPARPREWFVSLRYEF